MIVGVLLTLPCTRLAAQDSVEAMDQMGSVAAAGTEVESTATAPSLGDSARQSVQSIGEATGDIGGAIKSGGSAAVEQGRKLWQDALLPAAQRTTSAIPALLKALLLLLAFWIAGRLAGACVRKLLNLTRIDNLAAKDWGLEGMLKRPDGTQRSLAAMTGNMVKWLLLLFGFVAFFNALNLTQVAGPLQGVLDRIVSIVPSLLHGAAILLIYWAIAAVVRMAIIRGLGALKFDERAGKRLAVKGSEDNAGAAPSVMIGRLAFYVILLFGVPPFLQALGQEALVVPLQNMLSTALEFLPKLIAAALILVVGRIVATIVREVIGNFLAAGGIDKGADKLGLDKFLGEIKVSDIVARIAYFFILIPIIISAVDSLSIKVISDPIKSMLQGILAAVPALLAATVIVIIGCLVARLVRSLVENFLSGVGFDSLPGRLGLDFLEPKSGQLGLSGIGGAIVGVIIILITAQQATATLKFTQLADLLRQVVEYLPHLLAALGILLAAFSIGKYVGTLVARAMEGQSHAGLLSAVARYAITLLGVGMALEQLGIGAEIVGIAIAAILGGAALALGLAFGLGGKDQARETIDRWTKKTE